MSEQNAESDLKSMKLRRLTGPKVTARPPDVSGKKTHRCTLCDYFTTHTSTFKSHLVRHSGVKNYFCNECDSKPLFYNRSDLERHCDRRHREKGFHCDYCHSAFAEPRTRKDHINAVHLNHKQYKCLECPDSFTTPKHKRQHVVKAHGGQPLPYQSRCPSDHFYHCGICGKGGERKLPMLEHIDTYMVEVFFCPFCASSAASFDVVLEHISVKHP